MSNTAFFLFFLLIVNKLFTSFCVRVPVLYVPVLFLSYHEMDNSFVHLLFTRLQIKD